MRNQLNQSKCKTATSKWTTAIWLGACMTAGGAAAAQNNVTAERSAEIALFAQTTALRPDWGPGNNIGFTAGADYTRFVRAFVQPSFEMRVTRSTGPNVTENSFAGGLKLQANYGGFHPYATFLSGGGTIKFNPAIVTTNNGIYSSDNSIVYSIGGGAEFDVHSQWKIRVDFTQQHWNLSPVVLLPMAVGLGISYTIPFQNGNIK